MKKDLKKLDTPRTVSLKYIGCRCSIKGLNLILCGNGDIISSSENPKNPAEFTISGIKDGQFIIIPRVHQPEFAWLAPKELIELKETFS